MGLERVGGKCEEGTLLSRKAVVAVWVGDEVDTRGTSRR